MYSYSYRLGWQAGYNGNGNDIAISCPFPFGSYEYRDWWDGYDDGEDEYYWD